MPINWRIISLRPAFPYQAGLLQGLSFLQGESFFRLLPTGGKDKELLKDGDEITQTKDFKTLEDMVGEIIFMVTDNGEKE